MDSITFRGEEFPVREIFLPEDGWVLIATQDLEDRLISDNGEYVSKEAQSVDEEIFFYVEDAEALMADDLEDQVIEAVA